MASYRNFREFYEGELHGDLIRLDAARKKTRRQTITVVVCSVTALALEIALIPGDTSFPKSIPVILTSLAFLILLGIYSKSYRDE